jgi:enoyl reductase
MASSVVFRSYGDPDVLELVEVPAPTAGEKEVRVRVRAAGVNPVDCKIRRGAFATADEPDVFPQTLGNEFAGVVDQVGSAVTGVSVGDEVLGFATATAYAEYVVVPAEQVTGKPAGLAWEAAGSLSAVGQTAYHALRTLQVAAGETLLVHAAAGGVGTVAVQLARHQGATVIGTASPRNHPYLRALGVTPVPYGDDLVERVQVMAPGGVDAALDAVGGAAIPASLELVSDRSRVGTLVDQEAATRYGIHRLRGARSAETLAELAALAASGVLRLSIWRSFPLAAAAEAHREVETGHVRGKVVLTVD